jgi:hypothetical protein
MNYITYSLIPISMFLLMSCGGGGGSAEPVTPAPPAKTLTVNNAGEFDYDKSWSVELSATGLDSSSIAYSIDNLPDWMALDSVSGALTGEGGIPGDYRLVAKASDSAGDSISTTFDISFKLNFTGLWKIDFLPESSELNYSESNGVGFRVSRGGMSELYGNSARNEDGQPIFQICNGTTSSSQLTLAINLNCVSHLIYDSNRSSEIIEHFTYRIDGTLELEDLINGEISNLTVTKLDSNGNTLISERAIYIYPEPYFSEESEINEYLAWVNNQYAADGLYYSTYFENKAIILKNGDIKTIDISDFNPFTQFPTTDPAFDEERASLSELWEINERCDVSGKYSNIDSQWFENHDSDEVAEHNTVMFADASLTVSNCQDNYGTNPINGTFDTVLSFYHSNSAYRYNGYDDNFSDSEFMGFTIVTGNTQNDASYFIRGALKLCQSGAPSVYALWYWGQLSGRMFGVNLTLEELELFCSSHQ